MTPADRTTIKRIVKVNHAGEYGAIRIYRAQLWLARRWYPDMVAFLNETLGHEVEHCALFSSAMPARKTRPCRIMSLWGNGGYVLGAITALMGRQAIWVCTSAVEEAVHRHLEDQLAFLSDKDDELVAIIAGIQAEELHHLEHANSRIIHEGYFLRFLHTSISVATEILIWLSTWGASRMMSQSLKH